MITIKSTLRTAPDLCKNVSLQCYLVATVIHIPSVHVQLCVCIHILHNMKTMFGQKNYKQIDTAENAACQRFASPDLDQSRLHLPQLCPL